MSEFSRDLVMNRILQLVGDYCYFGTTNGWAFFANKEGFYIDTEEIIVNYCDDKGNDDGNRGITLNELVLELGIKHVKKAFDSVMEIQKSSYCKWN